MKNFTLLPVKSLMNLNSLNDGVFKALKCSLLASLLLTMVQFSAQAQLGAGTYTINSAVATGGTNFQTFADAATALGTGVSGAVVINVVDGSGPYNEQVTIPAIPGASVTNTVTIKGNLEELTFGGQVTGTRQTLLIDGADYLTIDSLKITCSGASFGYAVILKNASDNVTISNCVIDLTASIASTSTTNFAGIVSSNSTSLLSSTGNNANNLTISGCTIIGGAYGIRLNGTSAVSPNTGINISQNTIRDFYSWGIYLNAVSNSSVTQNNIHRLNRVATTTFYGIYLSTGSVNVDISRNQIHNTHTSASSLTSAAYGIYIASSNSVVGSETRVVNNIMYKFNSENILYGLYNSASSGVYYYNNTISLDETSSASSSVARAFYQVTSASNIEAKNNIISITRGGSGTKHAFYFATNTSVISTSHNAINIDTTIANQWVGFFNTVNYGPVGWTNLGYDANSVFSNPLFSDAANGNLTPNSGDMNNNADNTLGVTVDFYGVTRSATPDMGAIEYNPPALDASLTWVSPIGGVPAGPTTITVNVTNNLADPITSVNITYTDGVAPVTQNFTSLNITTGNNQNLNFTTTYNVGAPVSMRAWINNVNGVSDALPSNDTTALVQVCAPLSGTYTINGAAVTGGTNFQTFADVTATLVNCGIGGPVTFNVSNGPYLEQVTIPNVSGVSSTNTITFNGGSQLIQHDGSGTGKRSTVLLDGAQYVTLQGFAINATGATTGWGVALFNASSNNVVHNNIISISSSNGTASNTAGIVGSGSLTSVTTAGANINNNTISDNTINGGHDGIVFNGAQTGNIITGNTVEDFHAFGIRITGNISAEISENYISRPTRSTTATTVVGIQINAGTKSSNVFNNRIHSFFDNISPATTTTNGIHLNNTGALVGEINTIYNNLIYNINSNGSINGILHTNSPFSQLYHNTIVLNDATTAALVGVTTRGYSQITTAASDIEFKNNIIYVTRAGAGPKHAIHFGIATSSIASSNNVFYVNVPSGIGNVGLWTASTQAPTLADWFGLSGQDDPLVSKDVDPLFVNIALANFIPSEKQVNNMGTPVSVATDILGTVRSLTSPDPGIYEWTPVGLDASISWLSPAQGPAAPGLYDITVRIENVSTSTINSVELTYTDGSSPVTQVFSSLGLLAGDFVDLTFTTQYNLGMSAVMYATIDLVNGIADDEGFNNITNQITLCSPLSGNYTINSALPTGGTNFRFFSTFASYLEICGVNGNVVATVAPGSGPYNEQVEFKNITGLGPAATVTINGSGETITTLTDATNRHVVRLTDLSYFTINNLRVAIDASVPTQFMGIHIFNTGSNISITNCEIDMTGNTSTLAGGIVASASTTSLLSGGIYSNLTISGNTTTGGGYGVDVYCSSNITCTGNAVSNNTLNGNTSNAIYVHTTNGILISGNEIEFSSGNGIQLAGSNNISAVVEKNKISASNPLISTTLTGILSFGSSTLNPNIISNNLIWNMNAPLASIIGLEARTTGTEFYFNTVVLDDQTASGSVSFGYSEQLSNLGSILRNNLFYITRSTSNYSAAIALASTSTVTTAVNSNNNAFYVLGSNNYVGVRKGTANTNPPTNIYATLAGGSGWQSASTQDANSYETNPFFEVLVPRPTSGVINNQGTPITGINDDIDGVAGNRTTTPDIGAYEFSPPPNDAAITAFLTALPSCGTVNVIFELTNAGSVTLNSVDVEWFVNNVSQGTVPFAALGLAPGASTSITVGSQALAANVLYDFEATASNPNGAADGNPVNDSFVASGIRSGFNGAYTINGAAAASATNYQTFQSIATDLNTYGLCGPVTITVSNGPYTEQVVFNTIPGSSNVNTVTLNGNGQELNFNPTVASNDHILKLDAVNYFAIENLTVKSTNASNGRGIFVTNGSSKILLQNNMVEVTKTNTSTTAFPIIVGGANWLLDGSLSDSIAISGNTLIGGYSGVQFSGVNFSSTAQKIRNSAIVNNIIQDYYASGVYLSYTDNVFVSGNQISRPTRTNTGSDSQTPAGIIVTAGSTSFMLDKNRISDQSTNMTGSELLKISRGIYISGTTTAVSSGTVQNNLIYGFTNTASQYGIQNNSTVGPINIYHNTVALNHTANTGTSSYITVAMQLSNSSAQAGSDIRNNIFYITRGGASNKRVIESASASSTFTSENNVLYISSPAGTNNIGKLGTPTYASLALWQGTGNDQLSVNEDPEFVDESIGNFLPTNFLVNNVGDPVGITTDILNVTRSNTAPDPGAYEFNACVPGTWTGALDNNWNLPGNWCNNAVPTATTNAIIPDVTVPPGSGNFPIQNSIVNYEVLNVLIETGASISFNNGATLEVKGDFTNFGNSSLGNGGGLRMTGSAGQQVITGNIRVGELSIENSNNVLLSSGAVVNVDQILSLVTGNLNASNATLTLKSTTSGTAFVDDFSGVNDGTYSGNITIERRIPATGNSNVFHLVGALTGGTAAKWNNNFSNAATTSTDMTFVTPKSNCDPTALAQGTAYGNLFSYHESNVTDCDLDGWAVRTTAATTPRGQAFSARINSGVVLNETGAYATSNVTLNNLSITSTNQLSNSKGLHLVSNPFFAPIEWTDVIGSNLYGTAYRYDPGNGKYGAYNIITGGGIFSTNEGFFIRGDDLNLSTYSVTFPETARRNTNNSTFLRQQQPYAYAMNIKASGNNKTDHAIIAFDEHFTIQSDNGYDAMKIRNDLGVPNLFIRDASNMMHCILALPINETVTSVPLGLEVQANGSHTLTFDDLESFPSTMIIWLEDLKTNTIQYLRQNNTYHFTGNKTDVADRFVIHFAPEMQVELLKADCNGLNGGILLDQNGGIEWTYRLRDDNQFMVANGMIITHESFNGLESGTYTLELQHPVSGYTTTLNINISGAQQVLAEFSVTENDVNVNELITFEAQITGSTGFIWDLGDGTHIGNESVISHLYAEAGVYEVILTAINAECQTEVKQLITVNKTEDVSTGIDGINEGVIAAYSNENLLFIKQTLHLNPIDAVVLVYNTLGQVMTQINLNQLPFNTVHSVPVKAATGIYYVTIQSGDNHYSYRMMFNDK